MSIKCVVVCIHVGLELSSINYHLIVEESSAKLTNQRISYAFTFSPFSFHARHILPASKFQHSYSYNLLIFYRPVNSMCENCHL